MGAVRAARKAGGDVTRADEDAGRVLVPDDPARRARLTAVAA